jgi:hypothetical protein
VAARHRRRRDHRSASVAYIPKGYARKVGLWDDAAAERGWYLAPRSASETRKEVAQRDRERVEAEVARQEARDRAEVSARLKAQARSAEEAIFGADAVERMHGADRPNPWKR